MKLLRNQLKSNIEEEIRTEKDYPIKGIEFIDVMPLVINKDLYNEITSLFVEEIKNKNIDYIVAPESRGFLFACPVANRLNIGCIPVRKKGKLPPTTVEKEFEYEKEYGKDILALPKLNNNKNYSGKKFYIIDDILATGNTMDAIKAAIEELNGNVVGEGVLMNISALNNNNDVYSVMEIEED